MLTISKPLSAGQLRSYHAEEFANARDNYYTADERVAGQWHGRLAEEWGLRGAVSEAHIDALADGRHPVSGEQLVRHQTPRHYGAEDGRGVTTMEHRAGWDATFSAPKSVSVTGLVGGDAAVIAAHRESVGIALDELERYVQARIGRLHPPETTGKWIAARFEHDSARPVDGYAAPQLHTHVVIFNVTQRDEGDSRALQPLELYKTQHFATAIYRAELSARLRTLGYDIEQGASGQPEIAGYSRDYLDASSPRRQQIEEHLAKSQRQGAGAAQVAAHRTREAKVHVPHDEMQQRHRVLAAAYGNQPDAVRMAARERPSHAHTAAATTPATALSFARDRGFERAAVLDERVLLADALRRATGDVSLKDARQDLRHRLDRGELIQMPAQAGSAADKLTTREMSELERRTIDAMRSRLGASETLAPLKSVEDVAVRYPHLTAPQRSAVTQILGSQDQVQALEGVAGAGKTTTLGAIRNAAEHAGHRVEGLAPTSRAAQKLAEAGMPTNTLQGHLLRRAAQTDERPALYVLDESSLASTRQMHEFLHRLRDMDRVLLVGDTRQHNAVEAGRPYAQLQAAGMPVARLDEILRQQEPGLKAVVEHLSRGEARTAIRQLEEKGRVHQVSNPTARLDAIAEEFVRRPEHTLIVSPDNQSRTELNAVIHRRLQADGRVDAFEHQVRVLIPRQELTGADRQWASRYQVGDVVRYTSGSKALGLQLGEYAEVSLTSAQNRLVVTKSDGRQVDYDPRHLHGVTVYRVADRAFASHDRVQFTAPMRSLGVANRELGQIERWEPDGAMAVRLDRGHAVRVPPSAQQHLDFGYAVTSHSSQGQTADRVIVHVDTRASEQLVNRTFAYVAVSRGRYDAQIYTDDRARLGAALNRAPARDMALGVGAPQNVNARHHQASGVAAPRQSTRGHHL